MDLLPGELCIDFQQYKETVGQPWDPHGGLYDTTRDMWWSRWHHQYVGEADWLH